MSLLIALSLTVSMNSPVALAAAFDPLRGPVRPFSSLARPQAQARQGTLKSKGFPLSVGGQITADNSYIVGLGNKFGIKTVMGSACATTSAEIFSCDSGPESFGLSFLNVKLSDCVYIVAWGDDALTNGVLASISVDLPGTSLHKTIDSGDPRWRVFATGLDVDDCSQPSLSTINPQIVLADSGTGNTLTTSRGWVGVIPTLYGTLQVGEVNDATVPTGACDQAFPQVLCMSESPHWMWYRSPSSICAFTDGNQREFLIFRIPIWAILKYGY